MLINSRISVEGEFALVDVGLKSEGRVALKEFAMPGQKADLKDALSAVDEAIGLVAEGRL